MSQALDHYINVYRIELKTNYVPRSLPKCPSNKLILHQRYPLELTSEPQNYCTLTKRPGPLQQNNPELHTIRARTITNQENNISKNPTNHLSRTCHWSSRSHSSWCPCLTHCLLHITLLSLTIDPWLTCHSQLMYYNTPLYAPISHCASHSIVASTGASGCELIKSIRVLNV